MQGPYNTSSVVDASKYLTLVGVIAAFISSLMAHGFLTMSRKIQTGALYMHSWHTASLPVHALCTYITLTFAIRQLITNTSASDRPLLDDMQVSCTLQFTLRHTPCVLTGKVVAKNYLVNSLLTNNAISLAGIGITVIGLQASVGEADLTLNLTQIFLLRWHEQASVSCWLHALTIQVLHPMPTIKCASTCFVSYMLIGTLVAKTLMTSVSNQFAVQNAGNQLVSLDVFALQASYLISNLFFH